MANINEIWRPATGYEGLYEVSNLGRVRNVSGRIKAQRLNTSGYSSVGLTTRINNGTVTKKICVHRLVALAFVTNPHNKPYVNHIDNNRANPKADNLEWVTASENQYHAYRTGSKVSVFKGINNPKNKIDSSKVLDILNDPRSNSVIAKDYGVTRSAIAHIKKGTSWAHITGVSR